MKKWVPKANTTWFQDYDVFLHECEEYEESLLDYIQYGNWNEPQVYVTSFNAAIREYDNLPAPDKEAFQSLCETFETSKPKYIITCNYKSVFFQSLLKWTTTKAIGIGDFHAKKIPVLTKTQFINPLSIISQSMVYHLFFIISKYMKVRKNHMDLHVHPRLKETLPNLATLLSTEISTDQFSLSTSSSLTRPSFTFGVCHGIVCIPQGELHFSIKPRTSIFNLPSLVSHWVGYGALVPFTYPSYIKTLSLREHFFDVSISFEPSPPSSLLAVIDQLVYCS